MGESQDTASALIQLGTCLLALAVRSRLYNKRTKHWQNVCPSKGFRKASSCITGSVPLCYTEVILLQKKVPVQ